eukprot:CAMPEP_0197487864 /NCGR_PEP_ID=MMETSP1311-20131121/2900_1 /TAXON_ID=464262 /ORGANISM="Genus nov. species nov., Strain RCC856" /LENGTH=42 /DNA_ID= /DNA_START= /DNA_END= /DNA_ORIENTATION=
MSSAGTLKEGTSMKKIADELGGGQDVAIETVQRSGMFGKLLT